MKFLLFLKKMTSGNYLNLKHAGRSHFRWITVWNLFEKTLPGM